MREETAMRNGGNRNSIVNGSNGAPCNGQLASTTVDAPKRCNGRVSPESETAELLGLDEFS